MSGTPCKCDDAETWLQSDTGNEFSGVCVTCTLCGRQFEITDVSEPQIAQTPGCDSSSHRANDHTANSDDVSGD
jgi:hypothetical protein